MSARTVRSRIADQLVAIPAQRQNFNARLVRRLARAVDPPVIVRDPLVAWMEMTIPGWLDQGHLHLFEQALDQLPSDGPILEIGSFCGLSTNAIRRLLDRRRLSNELWSCDPWIFGLDGTIDDSTLTFEDMRSFVKETFISSTKRFSSHHLPNAIEAPSSDFFDAWKRRERRSDVFGREVELGGTFTLCYIDGEHTPDAVSHDFNQCDRLLEPGGFILFDDSADGDRYQIARYARMILSTGRYELIGRNPNYLIRKLRDVH